MFWRGTLLTAAWLTAGAMPGLAGQQRQITGRVRSALDGSPLVAAGVQLVGTRVGVFTDTAGSFRITVPAGRVTLRVTLIGYKPREIVIEPGATTADVSLEQDVMRMEAVVVTGLAGGVRRRNLANAVSTVDGAEMTRTPTATLEHALYGKLAGADIQSNSGAPGGGTQVRLRGVSTVIGATTPLYVVDGVIVSDATVPSNVHVVTRSSGDPVRGGMQDNSPNRIVDLNPNDIASIEVLKGAAASAIYGSKAANGVIIIRTKRGQIGRPTYSVRQQIGFSRIARTLGLRRFRTREEAVAAFGPLAAEYWTDQYYDHERLFAGGSPLSYRTDASLAGGSENTRYYASGLVEHDGGVVPNTFYDKQSLRLNLEQLIGSAFTLSASVNVIHSVSDRGFTNNDNRSISYWMTFPRTPTFMDLRRRPDGTYPVNPFANSNVYQTADLAQNRETVWRMLGSLSGTWDAVRSELQDVRLVVNGGVDFFSQKNHVFSPPELQYEQVLGTRGTSVLGNAQNLNTNWNVNLIHTFRPPALPVTATTSLGAQYEYRDFDDAVTIAQELIAGLSNVDRGTRLEVRENRARTVDQGFFLQEELLVGERLLLTAGMRADRSSNNAQPRKLFYYPKASGSYRLPFGWGPLDELKLRVAWGQSGNEPLYGQKFSTLSPGNIEGLATLRLAGIAVTPDLHPERQTEIEGGLDAALFGERATIELTAFQKRITELLLRRTLPTSTGYSEAIFNGGVLRTRGVEAAVTAVPSLSARRRWTVRGTFSLDRSVVEELPVPPFVPGGFGGGLGGFWIQEGKSPTQFVGNDTTPDGRPLTNVTIGEARPDFIVGLSNDVQLGPFNVYALVNWQQGGQVANLTRWLFDLAKTTPDWDAPCTLVGCLPGETLGAARARLYPGRSSKVNLEDATFVKLRELAVTYTVPDGLARRLWRGLRQARLTVSGRNLYTWTRYSGMDPEVGNFGPQAIARNQDVAPYPPSRSFWFSVDLGF